MLTMQEFRKMVNAELVSVCGLTMDCLADFDLYNYYDPDLSKEDAREIAIEAAHDLLYDEGFPLEQMN
jgi:hypothetical protein